GPMSRVPSTSSSITTAPPTKTLGARSRRSTASTSFAGAGDDAEVRRGLVVGDGTVLPARERCAAGCNPGACGQQGTSAGTVYPFSPAGAGRRTPGRVDLADLLIYESAGFSLPHLNGWAYIRSLHGPLASPRSAARLRDSGWCRGYVDRDQDRPLGQRDLRHVARSLRRSRRVGFLGE